MDKYRNAPKESICLVGFDVREVSRVNICRAYKIGLWGVRFAEQNEPLL